VEKRIQGNFPLALERVRRSVSARAFVETDKIANENSNKNSLMSEIYCAQVEKGEFQAYTNLLFLY